MNSSEIKALLCKKYAPPVYAFFTEVANGTGAHQAGYADAVTYHLFPSSGHIIEGFEIKVSRGDWLRELKQPQKAGNVMQYCDRWWLVAPKGVTAAEEIPKNWGFYEIINNKFYTRKRAPELEPTELSPSFVAAMLRRATEDVVPRSTLYDQVRQAREDAKVDYAKQIDDAKIKLKKYREDVEAWEKESGLDVFGSWAASSSQLGKAVKFVLEDGLKRTLEYNTEEAINHTRRILSGLEEFEKMRKEFPNVKKPE